MSQGNTTAAASTAKPKRRWFQYRVRTLLILTTVLAIWLAWWSYKARQQRAAVAALKALGASIQYDFQVRKLEGPPLWPMWVVNGLGVDYIASAESVSMDGVTLTNEDLELIAPLTGLKHLELSGTEVSDSGLTHLQGLTALTSLSLIDTDISNDGIAHLKRLPALEAIGLSGTRVNDGAVNHLMDIRLLRSLGLDHGQISDASLSKLRQSHPNLSIWKRPQLSPGQSTANDAVVKVLDASMPADASKREKFLWDTFANQPDEQKFSSYTTDQASHYATAFKVALARKAKAQKLDSTSLRKALRQIDDLPVGAYQTTLSGKPVWIITVKWEIPRPGRNSSVSHIRVYGFDQKTLRPVGFVTCN